MADMSRRPVVFEAPYDNFEGRENIRSFEIEGSIASERFKEFCRRFCQGNVYPYRDALIRHWNRAEYYLEVDLAHINEFDDVLLQALQVYSNRIKQTNHCMYWWFIRKSTKVIFHDIQRATNLISISHNEQSPFIFISHALLKFCPFLKLVQKQL